jgi:hypothetical protein
MHDFSLHFIKDLPKYLKSTKAKSPGDNEVFLLDRTDTTTFRFSASLIA